MLTHRLRYSMSAEYHGVPGRHLVEVLDENRALRAQIIDNKFIVHNFVAHIDRRTVDRQRAFDDFDCAVDTGAETAGFGEENLHGAGL
jgi:hypothetical protein